MRIDLHTHSTASDGTQAPADLVAEARAAGLGMVALTDHDTTAGWDEAVGCRAPRRDPARARHRDLVQPRPREHPPAGLPAEPGRPAARHRAGPGPRQPGDPDGPHDRADGRGRHTGITVEEVRAQVAPGATLGRPHLADALVANGVVPDRDDGVPGPAARPAAGTTSATTRPTPWRRSGSCGTPGECRCWPTRSRCGRATVTDELVEELAAAGLAGLEAHHRDHEPADVERALRLAQRHDLVVTGSSDYHGTGKLNRLGERTTEPRQWSRIVEQSSGVKVVEP